MFDCQTCGACCAFFRVSFYQGELNSFPDGIVPIEHSQVLNSVMVCMNGTSSTTPRCSQLDGRIGQYVYCKIYNERPSPCREFESHSNNSPNNFCLRAREFHKIE